MTLTAVTASDFVGRVLVCIVTSGTACAVFVTDVIVIGVPHRSEVIALVHGVFKGTLARDRTVAVVRTVPPIHRAVDVSHYCSPPIMARN